MEKHFLALEYLTKQVLTLVCSSQTEVSGLKYKLFSHFDRVPSICEHTKYLKIEFNS